MTWSQQPRLAVVLVGVLYLQVSAWDERDLAELRERAARAKANAVRYVVEQSGYRAPLQATFIAARR
jgi:hypothetical protein